MNSGKGNSIGKPGRNNNFWLEDSLYIHHRFKNSSSSNSGADNSPINSLTVNQDNLVQIIYWFISKYYVNGMRLVNTNSSAQIPMNGTTYIARNLDDNDGNYFNFQ